MKRYKYKFSIKAYKGDMLALCDIIYAQCWLCAYIKFWWYHRAKKWDYVNYSRFRLVE